MHRDKRRRGGRAAIAPTTTTFALLEKPEIDAPIVAAHTVYTPDRESLVGAHHSQGRGINLRYGVLVKIGDMRRTNLCHRRYFLGNAECALCCQTKQRSAARLRQPAESHHKHDAHHSLNAKQRVVCWVRQCSIHNTTPFGRGAKYGTHVDTPAHQHMIAVFGPRPFGQRRLFEVPDTDSATPRELAAG